MERLERGMEGSLNDLTDKVMRRWVVILLNIIIAFMLFQRYKSGMIVTVSFLVITAASVDSNAYLLFWLLVFG